MDTLLHEWNFENGIELPLPIQRRSLGLDNDLVELLWQNGEVVLQTQTNNRRQNQDHNAPNLGQPVEKSSSFFHQNDNLAPWMDCPIDGNIDKEFCANILPDIPPLDQKGVAMDFASFLSPRPCFESFGGKRVNNALEQDRVPECSAKTIGSSNRVAKEGCARKATPQCESTETGILKKVVTSSCMGSDTTCWNTGSQSIDTYGRKRKSTDATKSESRSDATELESGGGDKQSSQKSRRSRVAEVHNLSERRRRDRINEKMRALQELIPHCNKSDKASMLDEAIEYMKSLQLQLQLLWMGSAMAAPMMLPGIQPYMSRMGMRVGPIGPPPMHPAMQNLMRLSRFPLVDPALSTMPPSTNQTPLNHSLGSINYQNQIPNMSFPEQYANYMGFLSMPNGSQSMNMFNHGANSATPQMNQTTPQTNHNH